MGEEACFHFDQEMQDTATSSKAFYTLVILCRQADESAIRRRLEIQTTVLGAANSGVEAPSM